ncbi:hypothetical protein F5Y15DRAFT_255594 [Xylariaceae sp. FL0016]|nr:hypothetical protein F5Y15DRAFT_255594 [Xylariaceae sp. FL0016]
MQVDADVHQTDSGASSDPAASPHPDATIADGSGMDTALVPPAQHYTCMRPDCGLQLDSIFALDRHQELPHAREHCLISVKPFKCKCNKQFSRLPSLRRHIESFDSSLPQWPCEDCAAHQGKDAFRRKDHLVQHLRVFHKLDQTDLDARFTPRKARVYDVRTCHFKHCEHYRDESFQELALGDQEDRRPFARQSDYTAHMKKDHDWSPYPCDVPDCKKTQGKGFFSSIALVNHREKHHAGAKPLRIEHRVVKQPKCKYCNQRFHHSSLRAHQSLACGPLKPQCSGCKRKFHFDMLEFHRMYLCEALTDECDVCNEIVPPGDRERHPEYECELSKVPCSACNGKVHPGDLELHRKYLCEALKAKCDVCNRRVPPGDHECHPEYEFEPLKVPCNACDKKVHPGGLKDHQEWYCEPLKARCPECRDKIPPAGYKLHRKYYCRYRIFI